MNILYFTTSSTSEDYETLINNSFTLANPSNQNFHHALIRAFACFNNLEVISLSQINSNYLHDDSLKRSSSIEEHIKYHYVPQEGKRLNRYLKTKNYIKTFLEECIKNSKEKVLLVVDALNLTLATITQKLAKKYHLRTLGIVTDNPNLITGMSPYVKKKLLKSFKKYDYYICLNENLAKLANANKKPVLLINGIYTKVNVKSVKCPEKYFFFGGALHEKYGVRNLVHAFLNLGEDCDLLIAGDGPLKEYVVNKSIRNRHITYLGTLPKNVLQSYENHAIANINPRPITKEFEAYCIPSKVIEYAKSETLTISTFNHLLYDTFSNSIIWTKDDSEKALTEAMEIAINMDKEEKQKMVHRSQKIVEDNFSLKAIAKKIDEYLKKLAI